MITYDSIAAMKMNRTLFDFNNQLNRVNKQLETGSSINKAADNPAVYNFVANVKGYSQLYSTANSNAQTGISMIDTELDAISAMQDKLSSIKDILDAANKSGVPAADRADMQLQVDKLMQEIYEIRQNTGFNGLQLFQLQGVTSTPTTNASSYTPVSPYIVPVVQKTDSELTAEGYVVVHTADELRNAFNADSAAAIALGADIDLSGINWLPLGTESNPFYGILEGNGYKISNLTIDRNIENVGLIGYMEGGMLSNVALENVSVNGYLNVGALVGSAYGTIIENSYVSGGTVSGGASVGGLMGNIESSEIHNSYSELNLVKATGNIVGGFVGNSLRSSIQTSYSDSKIEGTSYVGGFSGLNTNTKIRNAFSSGSVTGNIAVGGFSGSSITTTITNAYSNAITTGTTSVGGFIGNLYGSSSSNKVENSFYDYELSTQTNAVGTYESSSSSQTATLYGINTVESEDITTYTNVGWDSNIWFFEDGEVPKLKPIDHGPFPDKPAEPTYYGTLLPVNGDIRVQTGKDNTTNSYIMVDTIFDFDNNFSFSTSCKAFANQSLTNLETVQNQLEQKASELGNSRIQLVSQAKSTSTKVKKANNVIKAWTGIDADALEAKKTKLLSDITNIKALRDQTLALNKQMCQMLIFGTVNGNNSSSSLFSSTDWLTNLLSI